MTAKKTKPQPSNWAEAQKKLDGKGIDALCNAIVGEIPMTTYATSIGVSIGALITWIESNPERSARAREARRQAARIYDERALVEIDAASDAFGLAKAREKAQHLRWRASKIAPKEYGDKMAIGGAEDLPPVRTELAELRGLNASELDMLKRLLAKGKAALEAGAA